MKSRLPFVAALCGLSLLTGCSTELYSAPYTTKQHPKKYLFQMISVDLPKNLQPHILTDGLIFNPKATVFEFPVVCASPGETVINDQTKPLLVNKTTYKLKPARFFGQDRIVYDQETVKIGSYSEVQFEELTDRGALCVLKFSRKELIGFREEQVGTNQDTRVSIPVFREDKLNAKVDCLLIGAWVRSEAHPARITDNSTTNFVTYTAVRLLPPKGVPFEAPSRERFIFLDPDPLYKN